MYKYAQIDIETGLCMSISYLSGEVESEDMVLLTEEDGVNVRDTYEDGTWVKDIIDPKQVKIDELNNACNATILSGFTSSALGTENFYDFGTDDQINLGGMLNAITAGIAPETFYWKASDVPQLHDHDQFKQVFGDGLAHKNTNIGRYWTLKNQVLAAETLEEILAIQW